MVAPAQGAQVNAQGIALRDRGGQVFNLDSDERGIQNISGTIKQVNPDGTTSTLGLSRTLLRGFALCGLDPEHSIVVGAGDTLANYATLSGTPPAASTDVDGVYTTGANGSVGRGSSGQPLRSVILDQNTPFWASTTFRIRTTGNGFALFGLVDSAAGSGVLTVGFEVAGSTTFLLGFKRDQAGSAETEKLSTIAIDGDWHKGEIWCDPSVPATPYWFSIDEETALAFPNTHPFANVLATLGELHFATTVAQFIPGQAIFPVSY